jgi:MFS family permease
MIDLSNRWVALAFLFVVGLTAPIQFQSVAALAPFLIREVGLSYTDIGVLLGLYMLPGVFLAAPSGPLAARIGDRMTLVIGMVLMAGSAAVFAATESFAVMAVCRLVGGTGAVAVSVLLPKLVTDWFHGREIATAMAMIASSVGFGIGVSMALMPAVAAPSSWQTAVLVTGALCLVALALLLGVYRDRTEPGTKPGEPSLLWRIDRRELSLSLLAGGGRGLFSAGYAIFIGFVPPLLIVRGMEPVAAGQLASVAALTSLVSVPLGGYLSDRTGKPDYFVIGGSLSTALMCVLVPYAAPVLLWVLLFGFLRGGCTGGLMSLPSQVLRPESRTTGFAVVSAVYFACMAFLPPIAGWLLDVTGSPAAPLLFAAVLWAAITSVLVAFRLLQRWWVQ